MTLRYALLLPLCLLFTSLSAQGCDYQIVLRDLVRGDGWNGGALTVRGENRRLQFTLGGGSSQSVYFPVTNGETITLDYQRGVFPEETSFVVLDNDDNAVYEVAAPPSGTGIFSFTATCEPCAAPPANSIDFFRARFNSVDLRFRRAPAAANPSYLIGYGTNGYDPATAEDGEGTELITTDSLLRITGLETDQTHDFYVATICGATTDTSAFRGPYSVRTDKEKDVGVTLIESPATGCSLGSEAMTIGITNYGGAAQQFFNVGFAVNGRAVEVERPQDGIFTGIVSVDSTEFFTFDARADLEGPGKYRVSAFTELAGDEDPRNDELTVLVVNQGTVARFPYVEDFEGDDGLWITGRNGRGPVSWAWGAPRGEVIDGAPQGERAWVTNLFGDYFDGEESYLISPCFDFSAMGNDPYFSCALQVDTEVDFDDLRLEMTMDGGTTWARVDISPADLNWYNDRAERVWEGNGGFGGGPVIVANLLSGAAGRTVQLRFVFESDLDDTQEGILIDAVRISERTMRDVAIVNRSSDDPVACEAVNGFDVTVRYQNLGTEVVDTVIVGYRAADGGLVTDTIFGRFAPGNLATVTLPVNDGAIPTGTPIGVFATTPGDLVPENDRADIILAETAEFPFFADLEDGEVPERWVVGDDFTVVESATLTSLALVGAVGDGEDVTFTTEYYRGPYSPMDTLRFRVGVAAQDGATVNLRVRVEGCDSPSQEQLYSDVTTGEYELVLTDNTRGGSLAFRASASGGPVTLSFDDIRVTRCMTSLGVETDVIPVTTETSTNGRITATPTFGEAPYRYRWSNGATSRTVDNLAFGRYSLTVTDRVGCTDTLSVSLRNFVSTGDPEDLLRSFRATPNPTSGDLAVSLSLPGAEVTTLELYGSDGRRLRRWRMGRVTSISERVRLGDFPGGIYLLRVQAGAASRVIRVVRR